MAANTNPIFGLTPNNGQARLAAANTASDGSGTIPTLFTAASNGSIVFRVKIINSQITAAASSANVVRVFETDAAGANPRLLAEVALPAATRTTAVVGATVTITFTDGKLLKSGQLLKCCQSVYAGAQDQNDLVAEGMDY